MIADVKRMTRNLTLFLLLALSGCSPFRFVGVSNSTKTDLFPCFLTNKKTQCDEQTWSEFYKFKKTGEIVEIQTGYEKECWPCDNMHERQIVEKWNTK